MRRARVPVLRISPLVNSNWTQHWALSQNRGRRRTIAFQGRRSDSDVVFHALADGSVCMIETRNADAGQRLSSEPS